MSEMRAPAILGHVSRGFQNQQHVAVEHTLAGTLVEDANNIIHIGKGNFGILTNKWRPRRSKER